MKSPVFVIPAAMTALTSLAQAIEAAGLSPKIVGLVHQRISQINGCAACLALHARFYAKAEETTERLQVVAAWREAPVFTPAERAALGLAEAATRLADRPDAVPDAVWAEASAHFDEAQLAALVLSISLVNVWNRLNVTTRQVPGASW